VSPSSILKNSSTTPSIRECCLKDKFHILSWWFINSHKFPEWTICLLDSYPAEIPDTWEWPAQIQDSHYTLPPLLGLQHALKCHKDCLVFLQPWSLVMSYNSGVTTMCVFIARYRHKQYGAYSKNVCVAFLDFKSRRSRLGSLTPTLLIISFCRIVKFCNLSFWML
jgi:hypothetical protein